MTMSRVLHCADCGVLKTVENTNTRNRVPLKDGSPAFKSTCKACSAERSRKWRKENPTKWAELNRRNTKWQQDKLSREVFQGYGNACACCGETIREFLQLDHVNGGGHAHRKTRNVRSIYRDVVKDGFPDTYRLLCANCNWSRGIRGYCPHRPNERKS